MGVIALDPTLFAENMATMLMDDEFEHISLTGIGSIDKVDLYVLILKGFNGVGIKYCHAISENCAVISEEHVLDFVAELTESVMEAVGIGSVEQDDISDALDSNYGLDPDYYGEYYRDIEDESEAFQRERYATDSEVSVQSLLSEYIQECFEVSCKVLTGGYKEVKQNIVAP